ncbi:MAG: sulfatase-like hydrolase/transferase, partial [Verrucomicrobiales bacterium]|nr:sulfatase-like hydrolase/transferase [Verrucomicrobiales bacterium]
NTLVIFTSDNGPTSAGGADPKFFDGNGPLRGIKFELYEGGIRCPFIAWWPGTISAGTESHHISAQWDMLPTFADLAGTTAPEGVDGLSMAPLLTGHADSQPSHDHLYWEAYNSGGQQAVRRGPWKAVRQGVVKNPDQPVQLYHLENDLAETTDVAASHPDVVAEMLQLMRTDHIPNEDYDWKPGARKKGSSGK